MGLYALVRYAYCGYVVSHSIDCKAGRILIVLAIDTADTTTVGDIREFIYLMRLYCGEGWREIRSISPSAFPAHLLACLLATTSRSVIHIYMHIYMVYVYSWRVTAS